MKRPSPKRIAELLVYDEETGIIRWRVDRNKMRAGSIAGNIRKGQRSRIGIDGRHYYSYRVAFVLQTGRWPKNEIDHRNHDKSDDRWLNIRPATHGQNNQNRRPLKTGMRGVYVRNDGALPYYEAKIKVAGKQIYLGCFATLKDAQYARLKAEQQYFGEFMP